MTEEATKSRALRRYVALWFVFAAVLGVVAGYFYARSWPGGFLCSFAVVFSFDYCWTWASLEKDPRRWRLFLVGAAWHLLVAWAAIYVFQNI